jgi:hypothetical protein
MQELLRTVKDLFVRDINLFQGFEQYVSYSYPEGEKLDFLGIHSIRFYLHHRATLSICHDFIMLRYKLLTMEPLATAKASAISAAEIETHRQACDRQSASRLLTLPREIRDKIWEEVVTGNIIHISTSSDIHVKRGRSGRPKRPKWQYYICVASKGLKSSVCQPGSGDHRDCPTSGPSNYAIIHLVCKQIHMELDSARTFFSHNALQFADLDIAYKYLFGLQEDDRASITHLRFLIRYTLMSVDYRSYHHPGMVREWYALCNYFSNIWDRKTVRYLRSLVCQLNCIQPVR